MKRILFFLVSAIFIISCEKVSMEDELGMNNETSSDQDLFKVKSKEALMMANVLKGYGNTPGSTEHIESIEPIVYQRDTLLFIVNYQDKGWVVLAGDKRYDPLIAINDEDEKLDIASAHNGVFAWLDEAAAAIYDLKTENPFDTASVAFKAWDNYTEKIISSGKKRVDPNLRRVLVSVTSQQLPSTQVGPLVQTKWGQGFPWNTCVPFGDFNSNRCVTGCVAVATAQLLYYGNQKSNNPSWMYSQGNCVGFSWDGYKNYSFSFNNSSTTVWDQMPLDRWGANANQVAILMGYVGWQVDMEYTTEASGAKSEDVPGVMNALGVTSNYQDYDYNKVISNLNNDKPVYARAYRTREDHKFLGIHLFYTYKNGHAWIIDGYETRRTKYTYTYRWESTDGGGGFEDEIMKKNVRTSAPYPGMTETTTSTSSSRFFIMNWGWDGSQDGGRYAVSGAWNPSTGDYKYKKKIICDFNF